MAIQPFPNVWVPGNWGIANGVYTHAFSTAMNASGDRYAFVIEVPKSGTLDLFEFMTGAMTNNPDNGIRLSFQDIDPATGFPDGTQDQYRDHTSGLSATTWTAPPGVMTHDGTNGGTKRTVTKGQHLGCVIDFVSFVAGDSFGPTVLAVNAASQQILSTNYIANGSSGSYAKDTTNYPILALKYDDGTYAEFDIPIWPIQAINSRTFNNGSTPDERALRFSPAVTARCCGIWARVDVDGVADLVLYDSASSVLASGSLDPDIRSINSHVPARVLFDGVTLTPAGAPYRAAIKPTSGTSVISMDIDVPSAAHMGALPGGTSWHGSTRTDAGAWSDTTTQRPMIGLIFDGFDDAGGGGGGGGASGYFTRPGALLRR
jgi:hypothetical protein